MCFNLSEVNTDKLQPTMNVSFWPRHTSRGTIWLQSAWTPVHSTHFILVCFILIMFSSTLNKSTLCTKIFISQNSLDLGEGGSSRLASATISIWSRSVCSGRVYTAIKCQLHVNSPLQEGSPVQYNHICIDLTNYQPHLTWYCLSTMSVPLLPHPKVDSTTMSSVKQAAAWEQESQKTNSAWQLYMRSSNSRWPMHHTDSVRPKVSMLWMQSYLNSD